MRVATVSLFSCLAFVFLISAGCGGSTGKRPVRDGSGKLCRVLEVVFRDGEWRTCGEITVLADGTFRYAKDETWGAKELSLAKAGVLPNDLLGQIDKLVHDAAAFRIEGDVPTYKCGLDDTRTTHPESVQELRSYVGSEYVR